MYNNYSKLQQTYVHCNCQNCDKYRKFKTQEKCPKQTREDYREQFGSFSISAAVREPHGGCCSNCGCCSNYNCNNKVMNGIN
jgi:hypothetical protein